jgi:hypothetical protein
MEHLPLHPQLKRGATRGNTYVKVTRDTWVTGK